MRVLVVAEGPSEFGELDALVWSGRRKRQPRQVEGYVPPMLRKLLPSGMEVKIEAQRITAIGRFRENGQKLPGHAERAAKALSLAATQGYSLLVFVKDVDRQPGTKKGTRERAKKQAALHEEIEAGFAAVAEAEHVVRIKATPCRMLEAWALGDTEAIQIVAGASGHADAVPGRPEELWGKEEDYGSNHPKCVLRRALGRDASAAIFEQLAERADPKTLESTCPESFAPFLAEVAEAKGKLAHNGGSRSPRRAHR